MAKPTSVLKTYYRLTKPGIVYGNAITAAAGFFLASRGHIDWRLFVEMLFGLSLIVASACVYNNYLDRGIDAAMQRTKRRPLPSGKVTGRAALIYATVLGLVGTMLLALTTWLALAVAVVGMTIYVLVYGYAKRRTPYGTEVGSIAGATPPVVGYLAVTGRLDAGAVILFLILVFWQMPHFYAIAIFRRADYEAAKIPVLPIVKGLRATKIRMLIYVFAFIFAAACLATFRYVGLLYLGAVVILGAIWYRLTFKGFNTNDNDRWARQVFRFSLITLTTLSVLMSVDYR